MIAGLVAKGVITATVQRAHSSWWNHLGAVPCRQFDEECAGSVHIVMWTAQRNFVHVELFYCTDVPCMTFSVLAHGVCHCVTDCSDGGCCTIFGTKLQWACLFGFVLMNQAATHAFSWKAVIFVAYQEILLHITLHLLSFNLKEISISLLQESEFVRFFWGGGLSANGFWPSVIFQLLLNIQLIAVRSFLIFMLFFCTTLPYFLVLYSVCSWCFDILSQMIHFPDCYHLPNICWRLPWCRLYGEIILYVYGIIKSLSIMMYLGRFIRRAWTFQKRWRFVSAVDHPQCPCLTVIRAKDLTVFKFQKM